MIVIVDYEAGNVGSILNMLSRMGHQALLSGDPDVIRRASHVILPGVGAFDYGMSKLATRGIIWALEEKKAAGTPVLGICLGAQLMCKSSEEGVLPGLSWIDAHVIRFPGEVDGKRYQVPHIGWDVIAPSKASRLFESEIEEWRFYFVHSYFIRCGVAADVLAPARYGVPFHAAFERDNIVGVQFHPEKSHRFGKALLKNFIEKY